MPNPRSSPPRRPGPQVGARLKAARQAAGLSLRSLGERVEFSASFLSQLELGQVSPSLGSLDTISRALGMSLVDLLGEPSTQAGPVLRRRERESLRSDWSRATVQSLIPSGADARMEARLISLDTKGRTGTSTATGRELAFCVRGSVALTVGEERFSLSEGDSVCYDASRPSHWENPNKRRAEILLVLVRG